MRFQGLDRELHVGAVDLKPPSENSYCLFPPCHVCARSGLEYTLCSRGHVTCSECGSLSGDNGEDLPETTKENYIGTAEKMWCTPCKSERPSFKVRIEKACLRVFEWNCPCGFLGTLAQLTDHIRASEVGHGFSIEIPSQSTVNERGSPDSIDLDETIGSSDRRPASEVRSQDQMSCSSSLDDFLPSETLWDRVLELERGRFEQQATFAYLKDQVRKLIVDFDSSQTNVSTVVRNHYNLLSEELENKLAQKLTRVGSVGYFWFDFDELYKRFENNKYLVDSAAQHKCISGVPLRCEISLQLIENKEWFGFFVGASEKLETGFPWPVKRTIRLRVHDARGDIVKNLSVNTFRNGEFVKCFENPDANLDNSQDLGVDEFLSVDLIRSNDILVGGKILCSLEVDPL